MRLRLRQPTLLHEPAIRQWADGRVELVTVVAPLGAFTAAASTWAKCNGHRVPVWRESALALAAEQDDFLAKDAKTLYDEKGGYRWITVHPHGKDEKGQPVKIRESSTQPGVWHVVGGAGGSLNYLKLTKVGTVEEYKEKGRQKRAEKRAQELEKQAGRQREIASMTPEQREGEKIKAEAERAKRAEVSKAFQDRKRAVLEKVTEKLGWDRKEWDFEGRREELATKGLTPKEIDRVERQHWKDVDARLADLDRGMKQRLMLDHEARAAAELGDLPLTSEKDEVIALSDLDPESYETGLGYTRDTRGMANEQIMAELAKTDVEQLDRQIEQASEELGNLDGEQREKLQAEIVRMHVERDMARLLKDHPDQGEEALKARETELTAEVETVEKEQKSYQTELEDLRVKEEKSPEDVARHAELEDRAYADGKRIERLEEQRDHVALMRGDASKLLEAEVESERVKHRAERERQIADRGGNPEAYRARAEMAQQALANYRARMKGLKAEGIIRKPDVKTDTAAVDDPTVMVDIIREMKALRRMEKDVGKALRSEEPIDEVLYGKPYFVESREATREEIGAAVRNEISEETTMSFLRTVEDLEEDPTLASLTKEKKREALFKHIGAGSYNALNDFALTALGSPVVPREVADVLGAAGTAKLVAAACRRYLDPEDYEVVREGLKDYHVANHVSAAKDAMDAAHELYEQAKELETGEIANAGDLIEAQSINARRRDLLVQARQTLGQTLGEVEAMAALVDAMGQPAAEQIEVAMGSLGAEPIIQQARAIGLMRDDYELDTDGQNRFLRVKQTGIEKLASKYKIDPEEQRINREVEAIKKGERDEPGWLPPGLVSRPRTSFEDPGLEASRYGKHQQDLRPFDSWGSEGVDAVADLEHHIGARVADGEPIDLIMQDVTQNLGTRVPEAHRKAIWDHLDKIAPTTEPDVRGGKPVYVTDAKTGEPKLDADGKPIQARRPVPASQHADVFRELGEKYVKDKFGEGAATLHSQGLKVDTPEDAAKTTEAMYLALADDPAVVVAFSDPGELGHQEQGALRRWFNSNVGKAQEGVDKAALEKRVAELGPEPERYTGETQGGLFGGGGEKVESPAWRTWKQKHDALVSEAQDSSGVDWQRYVQIHGGAKKAYESIQDLMRSQFSRKFAKTYAAQHGEPLRLGQTVIRNAERHLGFMDPKTRAEFDKQRKVMQGQLQQRVSAGQAAGGRFAEDELRSRIDRAMRSEEWAAQNQTTLLQDQKASLLNPDAYRHTLGERAENQVKSLIGNVARNFKHQLNEPLDLFPNFSMHGVTKIKGADVDLSAQQRAVKMFAAKKRMVGALGVGSGKTPISIGAFTNVASDPKSGVKRGLYVVPGHVQGQFHGELARFVKPGAFNWHADPKAGREDRLAVHADPSTHMMVSTYESVRDDMLHLMGQHGIAPEGHAGDDAKMRDWFMGLSRQERKDAMRRAWDAGGVDYQAAFLDEGHVTLDRRGKPDSLVSAVLTAISDNTSHYMTMTADPLKNDISEIRSQMDKLYPDGRYSNEQEWHRRYGIATTVSRDALRRETGNNFFVSHIQPPVEARSVQSKVQLTPWQRAEYDKVTKLYDEIRLDRIRGTLDPAKVRELSPQSFEGLPETEHAARAEQIVRGLAMTRDARLRHVINFAPPEHNAKMQAVLKQLSEKPPKDEPAVIFATNPDAVHALAGELQKNGQRVVTLTGANSREEKNAARKAFNPGGKTEATADVIIASNAGATGLNLQRGTRVIQYDTPMTPMVHSQRRGRVHRLGQTRDVELHDVYTDTPIEQADRLRMDRKYDRKSIFDVDAVAAFDDSDLSYYFGQARKRREELAESKLAKVAA